MTVTHWLYPTNESGHFWLEDPETGTRTTVAPKHVWEWIRRHPGRPDDWYLATAWTKIKKGDCVWLYAAEPRRYLYALGRVLDVYQDPTALTWHALLRWDARATRGLAKAPIPYAVFEQRPPTVQRANDRTRRVLDEWLVDQSIAVTDPASGDAPGDDEDARTRVQATIVQRQGQPAFRNALLHHYSGKCAVSGESAPQVLEAAHITPYRGPQSQRASNGLVLRADLHTLFDLYLISVDEAHRLLVTATLAGTSYASIAGTPLSLPKTASARPSKQALARHRREYRLPDKERITP